ncbi:unnamed protein product [Rotaria sp. Silwood1]|nr:unnamed protein product [Rotaria sp. Silwood1]
MLRSLHERKSTNTDEYNSGASNRNWRNLLIHNKLLLFSFIALLTFIYEWFPLYIVPALSVFSWICMMNRKNYLLAQLTAVRGLALGGGGLTLDWSKITMYLGSPLIVPSWALINIAFGFILIIWLIVPIVYGANVRNVQAHPIGGIIFPGLTSMQLVTVFTSFACLPAIFVHTFLFHKSNLWNQFRSRALDNMGNDIHARFMSLYRNVPDWWYCLLFTASLIVICVICNHTGWLKWYLVLLSLFIYILLVLPFGLVASITGQFLQNAPVYYLGVIISQGLSLGKESKQSYTFLTVGYVLFVQTLALVQDMKLGHYLKIGHRPLFIAQCLAGFICSSISVGIQYIYFKIYGFNNEYDSNISIFDYTLLGRSVFKNVSGFLSDANEANRYLLWAFLVGAVLPIPGWLLSRWTRFNCLKHLHWPLILVTISWMPALLSAGALFTWILIGLTVYFTVGKYTWTKRYIYLASGALDVGVNMTQIFVNTLFINQKHSFPVWGRAKINNGWDSCTLALSAKN